MTDIQDTELRKTLAKLFDAGTNLKSRAGGTVEAEFNYKKYSVDEAMQLFKEHTERQQRELLDRLIEQKWYYGDDSAVPTRYIVAERANLNNNQPTSLNGEES